MPNGLRVVKPRVAVVVVRGQASRMADETREERLAKALRDNLRRRKAQAREPLPVPLPPSPPPPDDGYA